MPDTDARTCRFYCVPSSMSFELPQCALAAAEREQAMILQSRTPYDVFAHRTLPGTAPLNPDEWLLCDEVYAAQMQRRVCLINERPQDVLAVDESARPAAEELLDEALMALPEPFKQCDKRVLCPDGRQVNIDRTDPMRTLGLILQEDLCLMQKRDEEHVLTAAVLCFPASWQLSEKFRRPLIGIHDPVPDYGPDLAKRVQRLFNGIRVGRPLWRFNALRYADPELFQPRSESNPRPLNDPGGHPYLRSERQCLLRLPKTQAVVFSIHTYVLRPD